MLNPPLGRKLRFALFGGGPGAFIGRVHFTAATLDGRAELVAGCFSRKLEQSRGIAPDYGISPDDVYPDVEALLAAQPNLPPEKQVDFIVIATPNDSHFPIAMAAVKSGVNVICDKPMTVDRTQARALATAVMEAGVVFALTHNYTGYPLVRQAREMIAKGELGVIQAIRAQYIQGWLRTRLETTGQKQAEWRTDPKRSGAAGCFGDIGTHAYNLARYMTGLVPKAVSANLLTFEAGRRLDDYGIAVVSFGDAFGTITASQISHGRENDLSIEIDGTLGSLSWRQENPNEMWVRQNGKPHQLYTRDPNSEYAGAAMKAACRLPSGHPEAFFEAFANVYRAAYDAISLRLSGEPFGTEDTVYPNVNDGLDGLAFITACVESSQCSGEWLDFPIEP